MSWLRRTLPVVLLVAGCASEDISARYQGERHYYEVNRRYRTLQLEDKLNDRSVLRELATDFEAVALSVPAPSSATPEYRQQLLEIEGRAWLRAADCHAAMLDSTRSELILSTMSLNYASLSLLSAEINFRRARVAESRGEFKAAREFYELVVATVEPDPGPDPDAIIDLDAEPEEDTVDDFVLDLPLRIARLASRDTTITDMTPVYESAKEYYRKFSSHASGLIRIPAIWNLATLEADQANLNQSSAILDDLEGKIPGRVMPLIEPADVRLASFSNQVEAWTLGQTTTDSISALLGQLIEDYPMGNVAPQALIAMGRGAATLQENELALSLFRRTSRDYPTSPAVPAAELARSQLLESLDRWDEARTPLRALPREFPTSTAALSAPLETAAHFRRMNDPVAEAAALQEAKETYIDIRDRYPVGLHSVFTRECLIQVYTLLGEDAAAINEIIALCDGPAAATQRPSLLAGAARRAETDLGNLELAVNILERTGEEFPNTRTGQWCLRHASRLRAELLTPSN